MKGKTLNLNEFLADESSAAATTVTVKPVSWADEMENNEFEGAQRVLSYSCLGVTFLI